MSEIVEVPEGTYTLRLDGETHRQFTHQGIMLALRDLTGSEAQLTSVKSDLKKVNYSTFIADPRKYKTPGPRKIEVWLECTKCGMNAIEHQCEDCNQILCNKCWLVSKCPALIKEVIV